MHRGISARTTGFCYCAFSQYSVDLFEMLRVGDVMDRKAPTVRADTTVAELSERIAKGDPAVAKRQGLLIVDANERLAGIVTRGDLLRALQDAAAKMLWHNIGRLPVVKRNQPGSVVGYLGRADILGARMRLQEEEESRSKGPIGKWPERLEILVRQTSRR